SQAQPAGPFAFLENFFGQAFSLKQAATSLAALAVMATGTTLYFNQSNQQQSNSQIIASNVAPVVQPAPQIELPAATSPQTIKVAAKPQARIALAKPVVLAQVSNNDTIRVYNREKGRVSELSKGGVYYGAESSAQLARPVSFGSF
ncbi:MAG: hypothetical protein ACRD82_11535, partial [Blastocatellia bacterium]